MNLPTLLNPRLCQFVCVLIYASDAIEGRQLFTLDDDGYRTCPDFELETP